MWVNLRKTMLSERSQTHKCAYWMVLFIWNLEQATLSCGDRTVMTSVGLIEHASRVMLRFSKPNRTWTVNFQMFQMDLEKAEEPETKLPTSVGSSRKQETSRKTSTSAILTMSKPFTVDHNKLWKILQEMGIPDHLTCMQVKKQHLDLDMEKQTGSKLGKENVKAVYCHPVF